MASASPELEQFVRDALMRGHSREQVTHALLAAGWSAEQIRGVLDGWAEVDFALPVPRPRASLSAREAFLYLLLFSALYLSALIVAGAHLAQVFRARRRLAAGLASGVGVLFVGFGVKLATASL